jgi:hypothetical protein
LKEDNKLTYLARTPTGSIKIGYTGNTVKVRLDQLEYGYGFELSLLATMPGDPEREREIHDQFASLRLGRTEQFRPGPDLMAFIGQPPVTDIDPDAVLATPRPTRRTPIRVSDEPAVAPWDVVEFGAAVAAHEPNDVVVRRGLEQPLIDAELDPLDAGRGELDLTAVGPADGEAMPPVAIAEEDALVEGVAPRVYCPRCAVAATSSPPLALGRATAPALSWLARKAAQTRQSPPFALRGP